MNGFRRLRDRRASSRSISVATVCSLWPGAKIARTISFIAQARGTVPPAACSAASVSAWRSVRSWGFFSSDQQSCVAIDSEHDRQDSCKTWTSWRDRSASFQRPPFTLRAVHLGAVGWRVSRGSPTAGVDYPRSYAALRAWFPSDAACLDYLDWLRWPDGFRCPLCRGTTAWRLVDGRWSCGTCGRRVSATAGTIFHGTRTPLSVWFAAAWLMVSQKHGISALGLRRALGIGSQQSAWAMLYRYRRDGASRP